MSYSDPCPYTEIKIITLCGSRKFAKVFRAVELELCKKGVVVLSPVFSNGERTAADIRSLNQTHLKKIALADEILVIDVQGYIGERTRYEINVAKGWHKQIRYLSIETSKSHLN